MVEVNVEKLQGLTEARREVMACPHLDWLKAPDVPPLSTLAPTNISIELDGGNIKN